MCIAVQVCVSAYVHVSAYARVGRQGSAQSGDYTPAQVL